MSYNLYKSLQALFPGDRLQVGTVDSINGTSIIVLLPDGSSAFVVGSALVGDHVYIRGGRIEGEAPALSVVSITV